MRPWAANIIAVALLAGFLVLTAATVFVGEADAGLSRRVSVFADSLKDPDPAVRRAAARGLGETRDTDAVPMLMAVVGSDADEGVRLAALGSLITIGDVSALPAYETALGDESEPMRQGAAEALSGIWRMSSHKALIRALKKDPSETVRRVAAETLGNPGLQDSSGSHPWDRGGMSEAALMSALGLDKDYGVRATSAKVLGKFKDKRSYKALLRAFRHDKNSSVRAAAARSLGSLEMDEAVATLIDAVEFDSDENVVAASLQALKYFDDDRIPDTAVEALRSASPKVRWQALDVLEYQGSSQYEETLRGIMDDNYESDGLRRKAREALQSMGLE